MGINWFSVKQPTRIGSKRCVPCVCYDITDENRRAVEFLAREGKAVLHHKKAYFQNGKEIQEKAVEKPIAVQKVKYTAEPKKKG